MCECVKLEDACFILNHKEASICCTAIPDNGPAPTLCSHLRVNDMAIALPGMTPLMNLFVRKSSSSWSRLSSSSDSSSDSSSRIWIREMMRGQDLNQLLRRSRSDKLDLCGI